MKLFPISLGILAAMLFGLATPASKLLLDEMNVFLLAGLLYLGGAIGVIPILLREKSSSDLRPRHPSSSNTSNTQWYYICGTILCGGILGPILLLLGLRMAHATTVAIWLNMELVATAILGTLLFHDHLDSNGWLGVALALCAGVTMTLFEGQTGWPAALLVTGACFCWGFDNHFTALIDRFSPAGITFIKGLCAGGVNCLLGLIALNNLPTVTTCLLALALGVLSYGLSIVFYVSSAHQLGATRSQILFSSSPLFAVGLAVLMLNEPFLPVHVLAIAFIACGIYFSNRIRHNHRHSHQERMHTHLHDHDDDHHNHSHPDLPPDRPHSHTHNHPPTTHSHSHYPDLHHRHKHKSSPTKPS